MGMSKIARVRMNNMKKMEMSGIKKKLKTSGGRSISSTIHRIY